MSQEIIKFEMINTTSLENPSDFKEEFQDIYYQDNKMFVSETSININNTVLVEYMRNDKLRNCETFPVDHIKTDSPSSDVNDLVSNKVKVEDGICPSDIQIKFDNELLCNYCHEVYQDYCTECRKLVHILNQRPAHNISNRVRDLPKFMLEVRESIGHLGIFSLKVIPKDVRFGPFTGFNSAEHSLRIKGGRFVVSDDKSEDLNWMQYINPAKNIYEQNLLPLQYEDKLYYCSTRTIQEGEELLVYFGEEYEDNLFKNLEMDFVPITKNDVENVFACTFCCLGFSSKECLAKHKTVCYHETNKMFSVEELAQCPFCKVYMEVKEYFEQHMDYCCETTTRHCVYPQRKVRKREVETFSSLRSKAQRRKRGIYKCTQCEFRTMYNAELRQHSNEHYKVKMYKCGICRSRYNARASLKTHVEQIHANNEGRVSQKYSTCDYFEVNIENNIQRSPRSRVGKKYCQYLKRQFQTSHKYHLKSLTKIKHLNRGKYKCANCEFRTYYRTHLEMHMKIKHFIEINYKCMDCEYKTNRKSHLERHMKARHFKLSDYKCVDCDYQTYSKSNLEVRIKSKHLKLYDYKCIACEYQTNDKSSLERHIKVKHLKLGDYKCMDCEYQTSRKSNLQIHIKTKHLKSSDYKCMECAYQTNHKTNLERHIKTKHLMSRDYKCMGCEYQTYSMTNLEIHIKTKHLKSRDNKCMECGYQTHYKSSLDVHVMLKHLKLREYKCMDCEYQTSFKSKLEKHIKTIHLKVSDYKCMDCEYQTNYKANLKKHMKAKHLKQMDYKCIECEYKTNYKSDLEKHIKGKHMKQSDYKCTECEFKTYYKSSLRQHIKAKHLKENDYKCKQCEFKTYYKSSLRLHMKAKHLKENDFISA